MITLVGVGHVFDIERQVRALIRRQRPSAVGVELDKARYEALTDPKGRRSAPLPYLLLALTQKRIARQYERSVGSEMLAAVNEACYTGAQVIFIDVDAAMMFRKLWEEMPFKEKVLLLMSGLTGLIVSRKKVESELKKFEENEAGYLELLAKEFPTLKKVLIDDRNLVMAKRIALAEQRFGNVMAVIGDGHVEGVQKILAREDISVIRLRELREMKVEDETSEERGNCEVNISFYV
ncbi:MAG: TraB/GumN family protein [Methanomassiliicoccales archaeon]|nr:MAG: TraB/GumN family protein [Methanomassiliicoccales archaeon]